LPRIAPTHTFDIPIVIISSDVVRPIAVPRFEWWTTSGIDGHMLACRCASKVFITSQIYFYLAMIRNSINNLQTLLC